MATIREIRRKLQSVHNIQKITQAMEMVAASRLRRAQAKAEMSRPYAIKLRAILDNIMSTSDELTHPLINKREVKKIGLVIIAGDRGLCGAYNQTVFSTAEKMLKNYHPKQIELILVGRKTIEYFSGKKWQIGETIPEWGGKITYPQIEAFTYHLINQYLGANLDEIWLIYTHYMSIVSRKIMIEKLLNIDHSKSESNRKVTNYIFEPNASEIFAEILPHYCITKVQSALNEAYASELGARIFSMRAATKNAKEMIEKLTLVRNKVRQTGITRELIEVTSGMENLK